MGDALVIYICLFVPTATLNYLGSGRDRILFLTRPRTSRVALVLALFAGFLTLLWLGFPPSWALALVTGAPMGAGIGNWAAGDGPIIMRYRLFGR